ncbi:hypothetical protein D3C86_2168300 [compost metagenome]
MKQRIEHAVGPLHASARELTHAFEDRVAVQVALRQDPQHERGCRRGDQVLIDAHGTSYT